jgi:radical SAM protein with 4Fe4S-binding SPASM domain
LVDEFLEDRRFKYLPKMAWNNHQNETFNNRYLNLEFGSTLLNLGDPVIPNINTVQILRDLSVISKGEVCYASKPNTFVISPDGKLMKCTVHLADKMNDIGYIDISGNFVVDPSKESFWSSKVVEKVCLSCALFPICLAGAGCKHKFHANFNLCEKARVNIIRCLTAISREEINIQQMWE